MGSVANVAKHLPTSPNCWAAPAVGLAPTSRGGLGGFFKLLLRRDSWVEDIKCIGAEGRPALFAILEHDQTLFEYSGNVHRSLFATENRPLRCNATRSLFVSLLFKTMIGSLQAAYMPLANPLGNCL